MNKKVINFLYFFEKKQDKRGFLCYNYKEHTNLQQLAVTAGCSERKNGSCYMKSHAVR